MTFTEKTAITAVIGGTADPDSYRDGGGKPACRSGNAGRFANGAVTGAFVMAFNHLMHEDPPTSKDSPMKEEGVSNQYSSYGKAASEAYENGFNTGYRLGVKGKYYEFVMNKILSSYHGIDQKNEAIVISNFGFTALPHLDGLNDGYAFGYSIYENNHPKIILHTDFNIVVLKDL